MINESSWLLPVYIMMATIALVPIEKSDISLPVCASGFCV